MKYENKKRENMRALPTLVRYTKPKNFKYELFTLKELDLLGFIESNFKKYDKRQIKVLKEYRYSDEIAINKIYSSKSISGEKYLIIEYTNWFTEKEKELYIRFE